MGDNCHYHIKTRPLPPGQKPQVYGSKQQLEVFQTHELLIGRLRIIGEGLSQTWKQMFTNKDKAPLPNLSCYSNFTQLGLIQVEITSLKYEVLRRLCSADFLNKLHTFNIVVNAH